jgi:hypothetical protein
MKIYINGYKLSVILNPKYWHFFFRTIDWRRDEPCKHCGKMPSKEGHDACIANLPGIKYACCGHGVEDGYLFFENGIIIRGKFTIEKA